MKFFIKDIFSKCDQIRSLRIWSHLLKTSLMESFIFVQCKQKLLTSEKNNCTKISYKIVSYRYFWNDLLSSKMGKLCLDFWVNNLCLIVIILEIYLLKRNTSWILTGFLQQKLEVKVTSLTSITTVSFKQKYTLKISRKMKRRGFSFFLKKGLVCLPVITSYKIILQIKLTIFYMTRLVSIWLPVNLCVIQSENRRNRKNLVLEYLYL